MAFGKRLFLCISAGLFLFFLAQAPAHADSYTFNVTINTSSLVGSASGPFELGAALGDASLTADGNNTLTLSNFAFGGGSPGAVDPSGTAGGATGNLTSGITLTDTDPSGLNYLSASFTPGNTLSFTFSMTTNQDASLSSLTGIPGDQFTFDIFDNTLAPVSTTDPVFGEDSFVVATICTPGQTFSGQMCPTDGLLVQSYGLPGAAATVVSATATPEPGTLLLLAAGILALGLLGLGARRHSWAV